MLEMCCSMEKNLSPKKRGFVKKINKTGTKLGYLAFIYNKTNVGLTKYPAVQKELLEFVA